MTKKRYDEELEKSTFPETWRCVVTMLLMFIIAMSLLYMAVELYIEQDVVIEEVV